MRIVILLAVFNLFFSPALSFAEKVYLKNGRVVDGKIISKTNGQVKVSVSGVELTYFDDEVARIEDAASLKNPNPSAVSSASSGASSTTKEESVLNLIDVSGAKSSMTQMLNQMLGQSSPEDAQKLKQIFNVDDIISRLVPIYTKYFSENEIKALVSFYQSPLGQKMLSVTPLIMEEATRVSLEYLEEKMQTTDQGQ